MNNWIQKNGQELRNWVSFFQLFVIFPIAIASFLCVAFQFNRLFAKADLYLDFENSGNLTFTVMNHSNERADKPEWGFALIDLTASTPDQVKFAQIPWEDSSYIRAKSGRGPYAVINNSTGHEYVGWAKTFCENCKDARTYWLYFTQGQRGGAWVAESEAPMRKLTEIGTTLEAFKNTFPSAKQVPGESVRETV